MAGLGLYLQGTRKGVWVLAFLGMLRGSRDCWAEI